MTPKSPFAGINPANPANIPNMAGIRNAYQSIFGGGNPMQAMQRIFANNPKYAQIQNLMRQGRNPESIFRSMARQRGIDPDEFIRSMTADPNGNNGF